MLSVAILEIKNEKAFQNNDRVKSVNVLVIGIPACSVTGSGVCDYGSL